LLRRNANRSGAAGSASDEDLTLEDRHGPALVDLGCDADISTETSPVQLTPTGARREVVGQFGRDGAVSSARHCSFRR